MTDEEWPLPEDVAAHEDVLIARLVRVDFMSPRDMRAAVDALCAFRIARRDGDRAKLLALMDVPADPRPMTEGDPAITGIALPRGSVWAWAHEESPSPAAVQRSKDEDAFRRKLAEVRFGRWNHEAAMVHKDRLRQHAALLRLWAQGELGELPPVWPAEWGPM